MNTQFSARKAVSTILAPFLWLKKTISDFFSFLYYVLRRFLVDRGTSSSAALTYSSLLALVPLTTIAFAIFAAFPAFSEYQQQLREMMIGALTPALDQTLVETAGDAIVVGATPASEGIVKIYDQLVANAQTTSAIGVIGLVLTAVLVLFNIEGAFNAIWRVRRPRPMLFRILAFWAVLTLTPIFLAASLSLSTVIDRFILLAGDTGLREQAAMMLPYLLLAVSLTIIYIFIPNRHVRVRDALLGGLIAAALIVLLKNGFVWYIHTFEAYRNVYGALATIPIFLLWLYILWSAVLLGAVVTAARPEWASGYAEELLPNADPSTQTVSGRYLALAVEMLDHIYTSAESGSPLTPQQLEKRMSLTGPSLDDVQRRLRASGWIVTAENGRLVIARDLEERSLYDLLRALGLGLGDLPEGETDNQSWRRVYRVILSEADAAEKNKLGLSVKSVLLAHEPQKTA